MGFIYLDLKRMGGEGILMPRAEERDIAFPFFFFFFFSTFFGL